MDTEEKVALGFILFWIASVLASVGFFCLIAWAIIRLVLHFT